MIEQKPQDMYFNIDPTDKDFNFKLADYQKQVQLKTNNFERRIRDLEAKEPQDVSGFLTIDDLRNNKIKLGKVFVDNTNPTSIIEGASSSSGTSFICARRDHEHGAPDTWTPLGFYDYRDFGTFADMLAAIGSDAPGATVYNMLIPENVNISVDTVSNTNINIWTLEGGKFTVAAGRTLTIKGDIYAAPEFEGGGSVVIYRMSDDPLRQIFNGPTVTLLAGVIRYVRPEWWGCDGIDDAVAINKAIASKSSGVSVLLSGIYVTKTTINIVEYTKIHGTSTHGTIIFFNPDINGLPCIRIYKPLVVAYNVDLSDFTIKSDDNDEGDFQKIGIKVVDGSQIKIHDIVIKLYGNNGDTNTPSTGIWTQGREFINIQRVTSFANLPIFIDANANIPSGLQSFDFCTCKDLYLAPLKNSLQQSSDDYNIQIGSMANITNSTFENISMVLGGGGFNMNNNPLAQLSYSVVLKNIRLERPTDVTKWFINWNPSGAMDFLVEACHAGDGCKSYNFENTWLVKIANSISAEPALISISVHDCLSFISENCFYQNLSLSDIGPEMILISSDYPWGGAAPLPRNAHYGAAGAFGAGIILAATTFSTLTGGGDRMLHVNNLGVLSASNNLPQIGINMTPVHMLDITSNVAGGYKAVGIHDAAPGITFYPTGASLDNRNWWIGTNFANFGDFAILQSNAKDGDPYAAGLAALYIDKDKNIGKSYHLNYDGSSYFTKTYLGGTATPVSGHLEAPFIATNSNAKFGSLELQGILLNNSRIGENCYYDGNLKSRGAGKACDITMVSGKISLRTSDYTAIAGENINAVLLPKIEIKSTGVVKIFENTGIGMTSEYMLDITSDIAGGYKGLRVTDVSPCLSLWTNSANAGARNYALYHGVSAYGDFGICQSNAKDGDPVAAGTCRLYIAPAGNVQLSLDLQCVTDSYGVVFGAGNDAKIHYDGTKGIINTSLIAASDLEITCGTAKTLVLTNAVYKDINIAGMLLGKPSSSAPGTDTFRTSTPTDTLIETYAFAVGEKVHGGFELQHDYKEGTDLIFHVHFQIIDAPSGTDNVQWRLTYIFTRDGVTLTTVTTIDSPDVAVDTQYRAYRSDFTAITGTGFKIGDQMMFTLERVDPTGDAFAGDCLIETAGIHYQVDTYGSRQIGTK